MKDLDPLLLKIGQWRASKLHRASVMPISLWQEAADLAKIYGVRVVSSYLKLNSKRLKSFIPQSPNSVQEFIKLPNFEFSNTKNESFEIEPKTPKLVFEVSGITIKVYL